MDLMLFSMFSIFFLTAQEKCTPIRILRSSSKSKSSYTAIEDTPKGDDNYRYKNIIYNIVNCNNWRFHAYNVHCMGNSGVN